MPGRPSEYSGTLLTARRRRLGASSRNSRLVQSSELEEVLPLLVRRSRFAVGRFPGCAVFHHPAAPITVKRPVHPLFEFRVPPESCPTSPSRSAAANRHLSWASAPYSTHGIGGPLRASFAAARYVPSSGFGYPLDGLLPPSPCRFYFAPAALLGFTLRSFLLAEGIRRVSGAEGPTCRFSRRLSRRRSGGPAQRAAASGVQPFRESLATGRGLARRPLAAPMGFALLGHPGVNLVEAFAPTPPTRFACLNLAAETRRRLGVSIGSSPDPAAIASKPAKWTGQPL